MTKTTKLTLASLALATAAIGTGLAIETANAHGPRGERHEGPRFERMLEAKADLLGLTPDELRAELETKPFRELLTEHGLTKEDVRAFMRERLIQHWTDQGLSQEEIDERLERFEQRKNRRRDHRRFHRDHIEIDQS